MTEKTLFRKAWEAWNLVASMDEDEAAREMLDAAVGALAGDELDVVGHVIARLQLGRERYGKLDLGNEQRDLVREALEEAADGFVYAISECIRVERRRGSPLQVVPK